MSYEDNSAETQAPTILTENIEISDPDEFVMKDPTYLTHSIENSDPDEFRVTQNTVETRAIETSDPDDQRSWLSIQDRAGSPFNDIEQAS